jgi:hypothetical protein
VLAGSQCEERPRSSSEAVRFISSLEIAPKEIEAPDDGNIERQYNSASDTGSVSSGPDSMVTDYILESPAKCPNCRREIFEKTLIEPQ